MRLYKNKNEYKLGEGCVIALGCFDGVHMGHGPILDFAGAKAKEKGLSFVVWTLHVKRPDLIMTENEKIDHILCMGADAVIAESFEDIKDIKALDFLDILINRYGVKHIYCGYNFRFGKGREGDVDMLKDACAKKGIGLFVQPEAKRARDGKTVSSTAIREALKSGDIPEANSLLGHDFVLGGVVETGYKRGRELGFPTANLKLQNRDILKKGVYATYLSHNGKEYPALTNVGSCPTFINDQSYLTAETYVIDRSIDLYGEEITVIFKRFIRPEKAFSGREELVSQIKNDIQTVKKELSVE